MKDILVSIIIPVYNNEQYIVKSIQSVLSQTHSNIELIVVNDGSTDGTEEQILKILKYDTRIKYFKIPNSGVSTARNLGLENATGKYVAFVDADDYIAKTMVETLLKKAEEYACDIAGCIFEREYSNEIIKVPRDLKTGYYNKKDLKKYVYPSFFDSTRIPIHIVGKLFKTKIIRENSLRFEANLKFGEDLLFTRKFLLYSNSYYIINHLALYTYVYNEKSVTSKYFPNKWREVKKTLSALKRIVDDYPEYNFKEQYDYYVFDCSMNSILNIPKNESHTRTTKEAELSEIVEDSILEESLRNLDFEKYDIKKKILGFFMKRKKTKIVYFLLELKSNVELFTS